VQPLPWLLLLLLRLPMACSCAYKPCIMQLRFFIHYKVAVTHAGVFFC
jgi:hypothetical protein